jgi:hypothetical protein
MDMDLFAAVSSAVSPGHSEVTDPSVPCASVSVGPQESAADEYSGLLIRTAPAVRRD